jgi:ankyrin repeat protein
MAAAQVYSFNFSFSQKGHSNIVQLFLDHGANPLLLDSDGENSLIMCCLRGHLNVLKLLYRHGARDELLCMPDGTV